MYCFPGEESPWTGHEPEVLRLKNHYRNPIALAREWQASLSTGTYSSRAELARELGVSRARVTQVLGLCDLASEVGEEIAALGDPLPAPIISERALRPLVHLSVEKQKERIQKLLPEHTHWPRLRPAE